MQSAKPSEGVQALWKNLCGKLHVEDCVPLFAADADGNVRIQQIGKKPRRPVLQRSDEMERKVVGIARRLVDDYNNHKDNPEVEREFDGMLYMMGWKESDGTFLPLYVGKTETLGRNGDGRLSANLDGVNRGGNKGNFARWGDNYEYHIGDLSSFVLPEGHKAHKKKQKKYEQWAKTLFEEKSILKQQPKLIRPTFFWGQAWRPTKTSLWEELGPTTLAVSEYLVIGVAGKISPKHFLNRDGVPRQLL